MITEKELEFLKESNHIEGEYSHEALEDAIIAWNYAKKIKAQQITQRNILEIHKRLMQNIYPDIAGKFRRVQVGVMTKEGFKEAIHWAQIKDEINMLCNLGIYPYYLGEDQIKRWHIQFEHIHPFMDGNGRAGRILMNIQRIKLGLPLLIIHTGKEQQDYYKWFK